MHRSHAYLIKMGEKPNKPDEKRLRASLITGVPRAHGAVQRVYMRSKSLSRSLVRGERGLGLERKQATENDSFFLAATRD